MPSFGEEDIVTSNGVVVGKIRVLAVFAASAIYPRLQFTIGCTLRENPGKTPTQNYEGLHLRDLRGELRLTPGGDAVGKIEIGAIQTVIANGFENQLTLYCDLDSLRVEAIERRRAGKEPVLFLQMWPILFDGQRPLGALHDRTIRAEIPRDRWLEVLSQFRRSEYLGLEIAISAEKDEAFRTAYSHLQKARENIDRGNYDSAVLSCRHAVEAVEKVLPNVEKDENQIKK